MQLNRHCSCCIVESLLALGSRTTVQKLNILIKTTITTNRTERLNQICSQQESQCLRNYIYTLPTMCFEGNIIAMLCSVATFLQHKHVYLFNLKAFFYVIKNCFIYLSDIIILLICLFIIFTFYCITLVYF